MESLSIVDCAVYICTCSKYIIIDLIPSTTVHMGHCDWGTQILNTHLERCNARTCTSYLRVLEYLPTLPVSQQHEGPPLQLTKLSPEVKQLLGVVIRMGRFERGLGLGLGLRRGLGRTSPIWDTTTSSQLLFLSMSGYVVNGGFNVNVNWSAGHLSPH